jgi:hypothetical protein
MWETPMKPIGNLATPERHRITPYGRRFPRRRHEVGSGDEPKLSYHPTRSPAVPANAG